MDVCRQTFRFANHCLTYACDYHSPSNFSDMSHALFSIGWHSLFNFLLFGTCTPELARSVCARHHWTWQFWYCRNGCIYLWTASVQNTHGRPVPTSILLKNWELEVGRPNIEFVENLVCLPNMILNTDDWLCFQLEWLPLYISNLTSNYNFPSLDLPPVSVFHTWI